MQIKFNTKTRSQGETLSTRLSLGPVFEFSRHLEVVTDHVDRMSLQILEPPPGLQTTANANISQKHWKAHNLLDYKSGVKKGRNASVWHPSVKIYLSSITWSHLQRTIWTLHSGERK